MPLKEFPLAADEDNTPMERRFHPRHLVDLEIHVTDLNAERRLRGHVLDMSKAGLCVVLPAEVPPGTALRLEAADCVLYGFVTYSKAEAGGVRTGVELQQVLIGSTDLARILESNLRAFTPHLAGLPAPEAYLG